MRKIIVVSILAAAIIGGYTAFWFKKADDFRQMLEQSIASLNDQAKALDGKDTLLRYTSIEVSGYPFAMTLHITKPILDLPVSSFLQNMPRKNGISTPTPSFEWVEEITYGDNVSLSGNIKGNQFTFVATGDRTHTSLIDRAARHTLTGTSSTPLICHLTVQQTGEMPWTMQPLFTNLQTFLDIFRSMDCSVEGIALKDMKSGAPLISSGSFSVSASNEPDGVYHKLAFSIDSKNAKATPAFDIVAADYMNMIYTLLGIPVDRRALTIPASVYGNQDLKIDLAYTGPTEIGNFTDPAMHFHFDVNAWNMKNDLFDIGSEVHLASSPSGDIRNVSAAIHSHYQISETYDNLIEKQFAAGIAQVKQNTNQSGFQGRITQSLVHLGAPEEVAAAILPKFHDFGKVTFDMDTKVVGPNLSQDLFIRGNYTVNAFNWIATPYGIELKGTANLSAQKKLPSGELAITCITCDALITSAGDYAMRVENLLDRSQNPVEPAHVSKDLIEGVRQFLHGIAENGGAKDLVIHLVAKDTGEVTVSGKQLAEVIGLFAQTIAPHLSQAQSTTPVPTNLQPIPLPKK